MIEESLNFKPYDFAIFSANSFEFLPAKNLISALKSGGGKISGILKSLSERNPE